jgi:predicted nucleotide-binding protein (sugar kinase/HSP70/actin superfamily)
MLRFDSTVNNNLVDAIENEGAEAFIPDLMGFFQYGWIHHPKGARLASAVIDFYRRGMKKALAQSKRFIPSGSIWDMLESTNGILQKENNTGIGWLDAAQMIEMIQAGVPNIITIQPFGCLVKHVASSGIIREIHQRFQEANILGMDFDASTSETNHLNRLKLLLANAPVAPHPDDMKRHQRL